MKKVFVVMAVFALLIAGTTSALAGNWLQNFSTGDNGAYDQIQITWLSGDTFNGVGFWYSGNAGFNIFSSPTSFIATRNSAPATGPNLAMNFAGPATGTSFVWQEFNGSNLIESDVCSNATEYYTGWTFVGNNPAVTGVANVRLSNPAVPEPSSAITLISGLGSLLAFRRRKA